MKQCIYCASSSKELRPYGPKGAWVCFKCAMETPERKAETGRQYGAQLDAAGQVAVIGEEVGPYPIQHGRK